VCTLLLLVLWSATHQYSGLSGDAELYAVQALSRIRPNLLNDLYLQHTSQDSYTIFSGLYARCVEWFGLRDAALILTIVCKLWFFSAAWVFARQLSGSYSAFLAVALLIVVPGQYGAYQVFHYAEDWLTARSLAEALVVTALVAFFGGFRVLSLLIACGALLVHPLMALPGLLVLVCLWSPLRLSAIGACVSISIALGIAVGVPQQPSPTHFFSVIDGDWLETVRERSQFLFMQLWRPVDWTLNARPLISLAMSALVTSDARTRRLCISAMMVGGTGLIIGLIASAVGPVSILLQGQAWRWVWVAGLVGVLLLSPTFFALWRSRPYGRVCAILVISGWTFPVIYGSACLAGALLLWLMRNAINDRAAKILDESAIAISDQMGAFIVGPGRLGAGFLRWFGGNRSLLTLRLACMVLIALLVHFLPRALQDRGKEGTIAQIEEFADWRAAIPLDSNVFIVPAHNSATFAWFTLERPSYLTVDQSSGVVFSRATALEVRRRAQVLLPLMDPDWKLLANMSETHQAKRKTTASIRPLSKDRLISLCHDPRLGFVVAREDLGFDPLRHLQAGPWQNWNLYDCRRVHASSPSA
jgi:hypothetical protein